MNRKLIAEDKPQSFQNSLNQTNAKGEDTAAHWRAVIQAVFVTMLWSSSWVLIKIGLNDIPALTFAGLRYTVAAGMLLVFALRSPRWRREAAALTRHDWTWLAGLGVVYYTVNQAGVFLGLDYLPAVTFSLMLNFTVVATAIIGVVWLVEFPTRIQWFGMVVFLGGVLLYFYPINIPSKEIVGLGVAVITVIATALATVMGRHVNRQNRLSPLLVTVISMSIGALLLLAGGVAVQGMPTLSLQSWLIVMWLAAVNTAFAFTLWNLTLRTLSSFEASLINNTMLAQIAILAWVFLGEALDFKAICGLVIAMMGVLVVQLAAPKRRPVLR